MAEEVKDEAVAAMMSEMAEGADSQSEDELMAQMAAMAEGGADAEDPLAGMSEMGALSQDEIDSLLGFGEVAAAPDRGIEALVYRSRDNYEKFPMLEVVFDRFSRSSSTSLRAFSGENVEITVENIISLRFEDYLNSIPLPTIISIFQAIEWENMGLLTIDSSLIYSLVDILLGGGASGNTAFRIEGRPFTTIEQDLIKNFSRIIFEEMSSAFTPITNIAFRMDRLETNPRFATITRMGNPVVIISLRIEFDGRGGKIDIILPYITLEPVKDLLTQMFSGDSFGNDGSWEGFLSNELKETSVKLRAVLDKKVITLQDLANLKVGSTLVMEQEPQDDISITCNGIHIFKARLGSYGENVAISITDDSNIKNIV